MSLFKLRKHQAGALAVAVLLAGCSASRPAAQPSPTFGMPPMHSAPGGTASPTQSAPVAGDQVSIDNFAFAPATLTVRMGGTVTWTNRDEEPHTVAANDGSFHSPGMGTGATFSHTFATPGK